MANDLNKWVGIGRLTRDPETGQTNTGTSFCKFGIASNGYKEKVSFFNCMAWSKTCEIIAQHCKKGQQIAIEGRLQSDTWEDKETGKKRTSVYIVVDNFQFLGSNQQKPESKQPEQNQDNPFTDDDIPF